MKEITLNWNNIELIRDAWYLQIKMMKKRKEQQK